MISSMQANLTIKELKKNQNNSLWENTHTKLSYNDAQTNVKMHHDHEEYSWRDLQGLSWIFEKEVYN